jgi:hypothetical protein
LTGDRAKLDENWDELERLYRQAREVLAGLDRLGLYQAGAYLSMALDIMRQRHPNLASSD